MWCLYSDVQPLPLLTWAGGAGQYLGEQYYFRRSLAPFPPGGLFLLFLLEVSRSISSSLCSCRSEMFTQHNTTPLTGSYQNCADYILGKSETLYGVSIYPDMNHNKSNSNNNNNNNNNHHHLHLEIFNLCWTMAVHILP